MTTVTGMLPAVAMSAALMAVVSCVALTNVVVRALPFQFSAELFTKFVPFTVSVKAAPPTDALVGDMPETTGVGLLMVNGTTADVPPDDDAVT